MFWNKKTTVAPRRPTTMPPPFSADDVLDALGAVLRVLGRDAFQVEDVSPEQVRERFERWAQHVLVGAKVDARDFSGLGRDWAGLRHFVTSHRRQESTYVMGALSDLRQVVMAFVRGLNRTLVEDGVTDGALRSQLERLGSAARQDSVEVLRREALGAVETMTGLLEQRRRAARVEREGFAEQVRALGSALEAAKREGTIDGLTKLQNRKSFDEHIVHTHNLHTLLGQTGCLLMIDIDHFKLLNDRHGHPAGDAVIRDVADTLSRTFLRRHDFVARYGGEEFAVVLRETSLKDGTMMAQRVLRLVRELNVKYQGRTLKTTISIGVADSGVASPEGWVERADRALYQAKQLGRDRVVEVAVNEHGPRSGTGIRVVAPASAPVPVAMASAGGQRG